MKLPGVESDATMSCDSAITMWGSFVQPGGKHESSVCLPNELPTQPDLFTKLETVSKFGKLLETKVFRAWTDHPSQWLASQASRNLLSQLVQFNCSLKPLHQIIWLIKYSNWIWFNQIWRTKTHMTSGSNSFSVTIRENRIHQWRSCNDRHCWYSQSTSGTP